MSFTLLASAMAATLVALPAGCSSQSGPSDTMATEGQALFGAGLGPSGPAASAQGTLSKWTIVLATFDLRVPDDQVAAMHQRVRDSGLPEARIERRGGARLICVGAFDDPTSKAAQSEFRRVRELEHAGTRPFALAIMQPPEVDAGVPETAGRLAAYDLRNVRAQRGPDALYTLQVGVYGLPPTERRLPTPAELAQFRKAAEEAAVRLRAEGDEAYFHHGARSSSVTVGVFGKNDHDPVNMPGIESELLRAARAKFPHNLFNGAALRERIDTAQGPRSRLQPTRLVALPGS